MWVVSLFSGIGGFDRGLERAGHTIIAQVENDPFCQRVLAARWPGVERWGDIRAVKARDLPPHDLLCAGVPCQDVSVAGKRAGLAGSRTSLFWEYIRILNDAQPAWTLFENVPGLLSSNDGKDFETVLSAFNDAGYVVDATMLDSQEFGVPQRRRRVFLVCVRLDALLNGKINSSDAMLGSLAAGLLRDAWDAILAASSVEDWHSVFGGETGPSVDLPLKRINSFGSMLASCDWSRSPSSSSDTPAWCRIAPSNGLDAASHVSRHQRMRMAPGTHGCPNHPDWFIGRSRRNTLAAHWRRAKSCITSTFGDPITERKIWLWCRVTQRIAKHILRSDESSPISWHAAASSMIALRASIAYARRTTESLFADERRRAHWRRYLNATDALSNDIEQCLAKPGVAEVLALWEGGGGDSPAGDEAGADIAACLDGRPYADREAEHTRLVTGTLREHTRPGSNTDYTVLTGPLGGGHDGIGRRTEDDPNLVTPLYYSHDYNQDRIYGTDGPAPAHTASDSNRARNVAVNSSIRRLTPLECERLQGFPDGWTCLCQPLEIYAADPDGAALACRCSDSPRYRALGNAVTVSVITWLGHRLACAAAPPGGP